MLLWLLPASLLAFLVLTATGGLSVRRYSNSAIGGWLGIACAVIVAAVVGVLLHRRTRRHAGC